MTLGSFEKKKTVNTLFQMSSRHIHCKQSIFREAVHHPETVCHLFDLHGFDLGLICFTGVRVRTGDMWH